MPRIFKSTKPQSAQRMILTVEMDESLREDMTGFTIRGQASEDWTANPCTVHSVHGVVTHARYEDVDA